MIQFSLKKKAFIGSTIIGLFSLISIFFLGKDIIKKKFSEELTKRAISITNNLAEYGSGYILDKAYEPLQNIMQDAMYHEKNIEYILFLGPELQIIAKVFNSEIPLSLFKKEKMDINLLYEISHYENKNGSILNISMPLANGAAGFLYVGISEEEFKLTIDDMIQSILWVSIIILISGSLLMVIFTKIISRPIFELTRVANLVAQGNLNQKVSIRSNDEIGHLGHIFNNMIRELKKMHRSYGAVVESALDAIITFDIEGRIIAWNKAAVDIFGYSEREALELGISKLMPSVFEEVIIEPKNELRLKWELTLLDSIVEIIARAKNGTEFPAEMTIVAWLSTTEIFFTTFIRDIQKRKLDEKEIHELTQKIIRIQEEERMALAFDLHDNLGQSLSALKIMFTSFWSEKNNQSKQCISNKESILKNIDLMIEEMRKMSQSLSPLGLESFGLAVLVNKFKNSLRGKMAPNLSINISEIEDFIPHEKKINIYRIIQESLTNIIKHAKAKNITISGKRTPKKVTIKVQDDGSGFVNNANPTQEMDKNSFGEPLHSNSGIGLLIMKERAKMMGGELFIFSNRDTGTEVRIEIPSQ